LLDPSQSNSEANGAWLMTLAEDVVTWDGWQAIDHHETTEGEANGRPRVKLVTRGELFDASRRPSSSH
jgi:ferredoxin--NADP+ reductase